MIEYLNKFQNVGTEYNRDLKAIYLSGINFLGQVSFTVGLSNIIYALHKRIKTINKNSFITFFLTVSTSSFTYYISESA